MADFSIHHGLQDSSRRVDRTQVVDFHLFLRKSQKQKRNNAAKILQKVKNWEHSTMTEKNNYKEDKKNKQVTFAHEQTSQHKESRNGWVRHIISQGNVNREKERPNKN